MPSSLLPKTPTPKVIVWIQSRSAGDYTPDLKTPPKEAPTFPQLAHLPPVPTRAAPLGQLLQPAPSGARGPLPAHRARGALKPGRGPRPPAPPRRPPGSSPSPPREAPARGAAPAAPHPPQPGTPAHRAPPAKEGAAATQRLPPGPGRPAWRQRGGGFTLEARPRATGSVPGAGGAPSPSVSGGGGSDGGTSQPPAAGGGKRATQGGSERGRGGRNPRGR